MFDQYIICEEGFRNVMEAGEVVGFQINVRLPYYRGLGLSMVEDVSVTIDGEAAPNEGKTLTASGRTYAFEEMETEATGRWEFGDIATLTVKRKGGLPAGAHDVEATVQLRISYLPFPSITKDKKTLLIQ